MEKIINQIATNLFLIFCTAIILPNTLISQNIGINGTGANAHPSALLDIDASPSNNRGFLVPRIPLTAINVSTPVTSPATSLLVYNTATASTGTNAVSPGYYYWDGTKWVRFAYNPSGVNSQAWNILGNAGTNSGSNFLGTTDAQDLVFKTNAIEAFRVTTTGKVGIGTAIPSGGLSNISSSSTNASIADGSNYNAVYASPTFNWAIGGTGYAAAIMNTGSGVLSNGLMVRTATSTANNIFVAGIGVAGSGNTDYFNVKGNGNIGINNGNPQTKLSIRTTTVATGFQLQDGSEGAGRVLTSDVNGKATWVGSYFVFPFCVIKSPAITQSVTPNTSFTYNGAWYIAANSYTPTPSVSNSGVVTGLTTGIYQVLYNYDIGGNEYYWTSFESYDASNNLVDWQTTLQPEWPSGTGVISVVTGGHVDIKFNSTFKYAPSTTNLIYGWDAPQNQTFQNGKFTFIKMQ